MNDFKRNDKFSGPRGGGRFGKRDFSPSRFGERGGFGRSSGRDFGRPTQMFEAICSNCGKTCEVPFRPTGERPVYCRDCFSKSKGGAPMSAGANRSYSRADSSSPRAEDSRIGDIKKLLESMNEKLNTLVKTFEASARGKEIAQVLAEVEKPALVKSPKKARASKKKK